MLKTLCPQGLANIERELCASSTACALRSATTALSHQAKALRSTTDERDEYFEGDTDKERLLLHCDVADDTPLGLLNWSVVHGTNMNNTSKLISNNNRVLCHHSLRAGRDRVRPRPTLARLCYRVRPCRVWPSESGPSELGPTDLGPVLSIKG